MGRLKGTAMTSEITRYESNLSDEMRYAQAVAVQPERGAAQSLLPVAYRGNPANVLIAIGLGKAIGIAPAQALYDIYVVNGRPSPSANLMAALVRRAGHKIRVKGDAESCTATLIRADDPDEPFVATWTIGQARAAGLASKDTWKAYPAAMLRSRAISEVVRMGASECVLGMDYSAEEMADVEARDVPTVRASSFVRAASAPAEQPAATPPDVEPETVVAAVEAERPGDVDGGDPISDRTRRKMFALLAKVDPNADDDTQHKGMSLVLGREVTSRADLTEDDAHAVIAALQAELDRRDTAQTGGE